MEEGGEIKSLVPVGEIVISEQAARKIRDLQELTAKPNWATFSEGGVQTSTTLVVEPTSCGEVVEVTVKLPAEIKGRLLKQIGSEEIFKVGGNQALPVLAEVEVRTVIETSGKKPAHERNWLTESGRWATQNLEVNPDLSNQARLPILLIEKSNPSQVSYYLFKNQKLVNFDSADSLGEEMAKQLRVVQRKGELSTGDLSLKISNMKLNNEPIVRLFGSLMRAEQSPQGVRYFDEGIQDALEKALEKK